MKASAYFTIDDLGGKHRINQLKRELDTLRGVLSVSVSDKTNSVAVDYDTTGESCESIREKIKNLGYGVSDVRLDKHVM
ncbi:MAG: heavy-metal-associated domain-containing protein [Clostridiales bacterium]|nr:heavy-metal-associated domain-containing protein [Clostridiales bacterium]